MLYMYILERHNYDLDLFLLYDAQIKNIKANQMGTMNLFLILT